MILSLLSFYAIGSEAQAQYIPDGWHILNQSKDGIVYAFRENEAIVAVIDKQGLAPDQMDLDTEILRVSGQLSKSPACQGMPLLKPTPIISRQGRKLEAAAANEECAVYVLQTGWNSLRTIFVLQQGSSIANARSVGLQLLQRNVALPAAASQIESQSGNASRQSAEAEIKAALSRVPQSRRPIGYFQRSIQIAGGINGMMQTIISTWAVFANGYATDCFDGWDPEYQDPTPESLGPITEQCSIEKWRKVGSNYETIDEQGDTTEFSLANISKFQPGQRLQGFMKSYGPSIATTGYIGVETSELLLEESGSLSFSRQKQQWQGGNSNSSRDTDVAHYYFDGYLAGIRYPGGAIQKFFVAHADGEKSASGKFDYIYWNGALFAREDE
ncbi:hypothetical protein ACFOWX_02405 [Sphingorhabdus arenilitoris]|uniref:Uncharacterized protein n=1 Tax=Sphingorhabdus arenilitoris TaxID=1490041 RepID=A0ABV8REY9_9SPHN